MRAQAGLALALAFAAFVAPAAPLRVVATSTDLKSLVEAVGGAEVEVEAIAPPSADPHAVEVKPAHIAWLRRADLLVRVGLDHEPWLARAVAASGNALIRRRAGGDVDASAGISLVQAETPRLRSDARPHSHGLGNPHYWLDPENAPTLTATLADALARARPALRDRFLDNRARFLARLEEGLARWRAQLGPWRGVKAVSIHDTWPYFAARFGIAIVAAAEPAPGVPPTPAEIAALTRRMRDAGVSLILADPHSDPALLRQLTLRTGARVAVLVPSVGGDPEAGDYVALFDLNVKRVAASLAGQ